jgi:16S rRNA (guanine527-N7)-methyltransferase
VTGEPVPHDPEDGSATSAGQAGPVDLTPTPAARAIFADRLAPAEQFVTLLATDGVEHGHIGPRERSRLWDRHLVNSALVTDLLPVGARVVDVGSGAGLPGIPMAIRRPDLHLDLVEPMLRRTRFLESAVATLELGDQIRIVRGRADEPAVLAEVGSADFVVARAVAPLDRLVRWCLPLLAPGGRLLALKGASATDEVVQHRAALSRLGAAEITVHELGADLGSEPTWVVQVTRSARTAGRRPARRAR